MNDFVFREVLGKKVHRLGLAFNYGLDGKGVEYALGRGVNYLFWTRHKTGASFDVVKAALKRDREKYVFASGGTLGYFGGSVRRGAERLLKRFDLEYLDVYQLFWLGKMSSLSAGVQAELVKLKEEGLVRAIGVSIHDRPRARTLAETSVLDMLMLRYNAAHPGAEKDIFVSYDKRRPLTVAYTATSWRKLLKAPKGWDGPTMTAGDCYRFCLSSPHVDVTLTGPANTDQLDENLSALDKGPLSAEEDSWIREYGRTVHG